MEPWTIVVTTLGGVATAVVAGAVTILSGRKKAASDAQAAINAGFEELVKILREQVLFQAARIAELGIHVTDQDSRLGRCETRVYQLSRFIRDQGDNIPAQPKQGE